MNQLKNLLKLIPTRLAVAIVCLFFFAPNAKAIMLLQSDDFESGSALGWGGAAASVSVESDGGPDGAGDRFLSYDSSGSGGPGSRMVIPNENSGTPWAGDYAGALVTSIELDVINQGATQLDIRLAITDGTTWYASTDAVIVAPGSGWTSVALMIEESAMTQISGSDSFSDVISNVSGIRLLSTVALPVVGSQGGARGDLIAASIGIDNVTAVPEPGALALLAMGVAAVVRRRVL